MAPVSPLNFLISHLKGTPSLLLKGNPAIVIWITKSSDSSDTDLVLLIISYHFYEDPFSINPFFLAYKHTQELAFMVTLHPIPETFFFFYSS